MERDVKRGCCSCTSYKLTMKQEPCKSCKDWSNWEDNDHEQTARNAEAAGPDPAGRERKTYPEMEPQNGKKVLKMDEYINICCRNVGKDGKRTKDDLCS